MAKSTFTPTADQIKDVFHNSLWYEIIFTFGVPEYDRRDYCLWEMVNFSRLGHARVLYSFLQTPKVNRKQDDVLAEDFDYPAAPIPLPRDDTDRLNKDLFHFTYSRLRHTPQSKPWSSSILSSLLDPVLDFMKHIRDNKCYLFDEESRTSLDQWNQQISNLETGHELQIKAFLNSTNLAQYQFRLGDALPNKKPILTLLESFEWQDVQEGAL